MEGPPNHFFLDGVLKDMWVGEGEWYTFSKSYLPSILPGTFRNVSIWLHSSRSPGNMIEFTILNYIKRSSLVRTLSHIKASLPLPRGRVPEDSSQQRSDMANPSKSWAMMTYSFFSFSLLGLVILRADWSSRPQTIKVPVTRSKIQLQLIFFEQDICGMESTALSIVICWLDNKA